MSGWPAFALLIAVKLLFGLLDHPPAGSLATLVPVPDRPDEPGTVPTAEGTDQDRAYGDGDDPDERDPSPDGAGPVGDA